jgi:ribose 1,5-bisphosphokinase PhnN
MTTAQAHVLHSIKIVVLSSRGIRPLYTSASRLYVLCVAMSRDVVKQGTEERQRSNVSDVRKQR